MFNFDFTPERLLAALLFLPVLILSLTVHEWAHAYSAYRLGDQTARLAGRMTLNPLAHIDFIGTIVLPLFVFLTGAPLFGWAKPVPVTPLALTRKMSMRSSMMIVSAAGPLANLVQALVGTVALGVVAGLWHGLLTSPDQGAEMARRLFVDYITLNLALCVFNLIPIPPLDGSKILSGLLPDRIAKRLVDNEFLTRYGSIILIVIIATPIINWIFYPVQLGFEELMAVADLIRSLFG